uniref:Uncharacterized protein n=1 Tax=Tanacetum cinerariifolium TaxID=118510 RepID=A0A6L2MPX6_TANCI|nr:hypothetical protein [Tanacetum cinerariifolium]
MLSSKSEPKLELVKRKTSSKRRVKKKVTLSADDNIISNDLDTALKLGKSISKTKAEEAEAARQVNATHERIVTKSVLEPTKEENQANKRQPGTGGSSEGTGTIPGVLDKSTVVSATSSEGIGTKLGVLDEKKDITEENVILEWGSEQESEYSEEDKLVDKENDDKEGDADDEDEETESDEDDIYKYKIHVRKDEDEEMLNAKVEDSDKGDEEVTDAGKADAEKTSEVKDDAKKNELPTTSCSTVKDTTDAEINSLLEVKIQYEVPYVQSLSMLRVLGSVISEPLVLTPIRVAKLKKDVSKLKKIDLSVEALTALKTQVPSVVDNYIGSKVEDGKKTKRRRTKESESSKKPPTTNETPKGKASSKGSKADESASANKHVKEPIAEVVMDYTSDDVVHDDDQPQDSYEPKTAKTLNPEYSVTKDPHTFNDLMATPIDFSKIELEYHFQECFNELTDKLDWNNLEEDRYPFDLSKPLHLQGHPSHLTVTADYFFNNDLEYLKSSDPERKYTTLITKTEVVRYEIKGIEDIVPTLWSLTKVGLKSVSVKKLHGYDHLEETVVKRADY